MTLASRTGENRSRSSNFVAPDDNKGPEQEQKRLQELFKYFISAWESTGYTADAAIDDVDGYVPEKALHSHDPVLNALAQLAAFRLNSDRAFISIIDHEHQFVIAECTKEMSLFDGKLYGEGQGLSIGARPLDLNAGVCAGTMPAFLDTSRMGPYTNTENIYADATRYIINDFSMEDKYKDRPYVTNWPHMRYYAEVPIKSSGGYVIGTLAVIDNKPRRGLPENHFTALEDISKAIMAHLEAVKIEQDHKQASKLLRGLNAFLHPNTAGDGASHKVKPDKFDLHLPKEHIKSSENTIESSAPQSMVTPARSDAPASRSSAVDINGSHAVLNNNDSTSSSNPAMVDRLIYDQDKKPVHDAPEVHHTEHRPAVAAWAPEKILQSSETNPAAEADLADAATRKQGEDLKSMTISEEIRLSFANAAVILREAMSLGGVVFLDAGLTDFASRSDMSFANDGPSSPLSDRSLASAAMSPSTPFSGTPSSLRRESAGYFGDREARPSPRIPSEKARFSMQRNAAAAERFSATLGYSVTRVETAIPFASSTGPISMSETVHQSLLYYYPTGKVFDFNHSLDNNSSPTKSDGSLFPGAVRRGIISQESLDKALRAVLPDVCSAVFVPLWHKDSWFASGLGWTTQDKRVLEQDDLAYFSVFGASIMAELTRLDLMASDRAKSNFISSISHELRSPLHGILGTAELLKDGSLDAHQNQMLNMIESCGNTLLETVSHILEYAKISKKTSTSNESRNGEASTTRPLELDIVLEETVSAIVAGHRFSLASAEALANATKDGRSKDATPGQSDTDVIVVVDIEKVSSWTVRSVSAAWRRIIMNLVGNSLKYTESGLVEVVMTTRADDHLEADGSSRTFVSLTVRDTGRGMSKDFLQNRLFTPFVQENELNVGTGLGLSIVRKIVLDLGGTIDVRSEQGFGTEVEVVVPLVFEAPPSPQFSLPHGAQGTVLLLGLDTPPAMHGLPTRSLSPSLKATTALHSAIRTIVDRWFGMKVNSAQALHPADVIFISREDAISSGYLRAASGKSDASKVDDEAIFYNTIPSGSSLIVISKTEGNGSVPSDNGRIQTLVLPIGPRRLRGAIRTALIADRSAEVRIPQKAFEKSSAMVRSASGAWNWKGTDVSVTRTRPPSAATSRSVTPMSRDPQKARLSPPARVDTPAMVAASDMGPKLNLLIVDDNAINVKVLCGFAKKLQCQYTSASNGQEAVETFKQSSESDPFDYILMDVNMPVLSGFEATRLIRDHEAIHGGHVPIIALTGLGSVEAEQEAFTSGMDIFLTKPVSLAKVKLLVDGGVEALKGSA